MNDADHKRISAVASGPNFMKCLMDGTLPEYLHREDVKDLIEADRKQRHLKEKAQLEQEWSELKSMQAQYEADRKRRGSCECSRKTQAVVKSECDL